MVSTVIFKTLDVCLILLKGEPDTSKLLISKTLTFLLTIPYLTGAFSWPDKLKF